MVKHGFLFGIGWVHVPSLCSNKRENIFRAFQNKKTHNMTQVPATQRIAQNDAYRKISLFIGLLGCLVLAVNF